MAGEDVLCIVVVVFRVISQIIRGAGNRLIFEHFTEFCLTLRFLGVLKMFEEAGSLGEGLITALTLVLPGEHDGGREGGDTSISLHSVFKHQVQLSCYCHTA